ncbi:hypothetical protein Q1695_016161 [Nippostrongylus brasiliensis]|nr:hypothetical protein Q1695_016161 [Nippostrongylus brasiliensis]
MSQASTGASVEPENAENFVFGSGCGKIATAGCVTRFDTVDLRYAWVIEDFSAQMDLHTVGEYLTSKPFGDSDHEFVLKLFPAGKDEDCGGYISLFLQILKCPNPKMQLRIRFSVETQDGPRECSLNKSVLSINRGGIITASKFFHSDIVKNRFLRRGSRDALTVSADITVFLESRTIEEVPMKDWEDDDIVMMNSFDLPVATSSEFATTSSNSDVLRDMLTSGRFADFVVVVGDREFRLHRCVLAATSQYFSAMLKDQTLESAQGRVDLKNIDPDVFDIIVRYTYDFNGPNSDEITMDLIKTVDMLMMDGLKAYCCSLLMREITPENFSLRLQIADFLCNDRLFKRLVAFLSSNRKDVFAQAEWSELRDTQPKLACRVMEAAWTYSESLLPLLKAKKRRRFGS